MPLNIDTRALLHSHELVEQAGPLLKGIRILVVDDNEVAREILAEMLRSFQLDVRGAVNGQDAIEQLQAAVDNPFDVVLMDWRMPGMNGDEATRRIRTDSAISPQPKVVIVTAYGREEVMKLVEQSDVNGFLLKPMAPSTLLDTILSVLGRDRIFGAEKQERGTGSALTSSDYSGIHLLLVEDNEINREFAVELLHSMGITLDEAVNGEEAVAMVQQRSYDGILMDIQMPVMDGLEAARRIRALAVELDDEHFTTLPIIAMTAMAMAEDAQKCLQAGMNDYITKPVAPERLQAVLAKWLPAETTSPSAATNPDAVAPEIPADLLALKTVDAAQGIRRIGGKAGAYRNQLYRFRKNYSGALAELQRTIRENGVEAGEDYCHALKGVTGNLSANELFACISAVDNVLKSGMMAAPEQFERMGQLLQQTMDEIDGLATPVAAKPKATTTNDRNQLLAKLLALASLLKSDLGAADQLLAELLGDEAGMETEQDLVRIAALMDRFATDEALEQIKD